MNDVEGMNFDSLELIEVPVTIGDVKYVLREADEGAAKAYHNARLHGAKVEDGKVAGLPIDLAGVPSLVLSRCIFRLNEDGKPFPDPVSLQEIVGYKERNGVVHKGWPARIVKPLFKKLKEISELDDDEGTLKELLEQRRELDERIAKLENDAAKNEQSDTMTGSD